MDWGKIIGGAIPVVGSVVEGIINNNNVDKANRENREFQTQQQASQNAYNRAFWQEQNEYNSPKNQMARLKAAGINPMAIFGTSGFNSVSAPAPQSAHTSYVAQPRHSPDFGRAGASALAAYNDLRLGAAQVNNMEAQNTNILQDTILKMFQQDNLRADINTKDAVRPLDVYLKQLQGDESIARKKASDANTTRSNTLLASDLAFRQQQVKHEEAQTKFTLAENERQIAANSMSLKEAAVRILLHRSQMANNAIERQEIAQRIKLLEKDTDIKALDIDLKEHGIQPHDSAFMRALSDIISGVKSKLPWSKSPLLKIR